MEETIAPTHLIEFRVENFRSIREEARLSLLSTKLHDKDHDFSIATLDGKLLRSAALYGPNAGGKSNIIRSLFVFRNTVIGEHQLFKNERIDPFLLDELSKTKNTSFEATFEYNNRIFVYGFRLSTRESKISAEWLKVSRRNGTRLLTIYERDGDKIEVTKTLPISEHGISRKFAIQLQTNELFITTISKNTIWTLAREVVEAWKNCNVLNTLFHDPSHKVAQALHSDPAAKDILLPFLQEADIGITDIKVRKNEADAYSVEFEHTYKTKKSSQRVWFDIKRQESAGTLKLFSFALPLIYSLRDGTLMVLDELGSTLHPDLLKSLVDIFNDKKRNPKNAQLILTTHDTTLMREGLLGRDQLYFVEKNAQQATELYALSDIKGVKKGSNNLDERYLRGDFGAVPNIVDKD